MGKRFLLLPTLVLLFITLALGCAMPYQGGPSAQELANADYGEPPTDYESKIKEYLNTNLFDPFTAHIEIGQLEKSWWGNLGGLLATREIHYGWLVQTKVNAKNRIGGYVGWKIYCFYFRDGELKYVQQPYE